MSALSRLITKCTKRQLQIATTVDEISTIMDRTVAFAEAENPYISDEEIDSLLPYIPVTEPETPSDATEADDGTNTQDADESGSDGGSESEGA